MGHASSAKARIEPSWSCASALVGKSSRQRARGSCSTDSGKPEDVENNYPDASVVFSNIKYGDIDSTYDTSLPRVIA